MGVYAEFEQVHNADGCGDSELAGFCNSCNFEGELQSDGCCPQCGNGTETHFINDPGLGWCDDCEVELVLESDGTCTSCGSGVNTHFYVEPS